MNTLRNALRASTTLAILVGAGLSLPSTARADDAETQPLLTAGLDRIGANKPLDQAGIKVGGYADASWTISGSNPPGNVISDRGFDFENQDLTLNGIDLFIKRDVDVTKYDYGFHLEMLYGGDARFTHSNGILDNKGFTFGATHDRDTGPDEQFDITQAFVQLSAPWGHGVAFTIGKFITPIGYEYVDPTKNTLYSHSYLFNFAAPYSQLGVTGTYAFSDQITLMAGVTRGWDQSFKDNNGAVDFIGSVDYKPDSQWDLTLILSTGPQEPDSYGYRTTFDGLIAYALNEKWNLGGEVLYAVEADVPGTSDNYSQWYGAAFYPTYKVCPHVNINARVEWFCDNDRVRGVGANNAFEATLGVTLLPLHDVPAVGDNFKIRPEVRFDYADDRAFDDGSGYSQTTFAVDAVLSF